MRGKVVNSAASQDGAKRWDIVVAEVSTQQECEDKESFTRDGHQETVPFRKSWSI